MEVFARIPRDRDIPSYCILVHQRRKLWIWAWISGITALLSLGLTIIGWPEGSYRPSWSPYVNTLTLATPLIAGTLFAMAYMARRHFSRIMARSQMVCLPQRDGTDLAGMMNQLAVTNLQAIRRGNGERSLRLVRSIVENYAVGMEVARDLQKLQRLANG